MNVLSLVKRRRQKTGFQFKKVEIDVAIINRIHNLFRVSYTTGNVNFVQRVHFLVDNFVLHAAIYKCTDYMSVFLKKHLQ